MKDQEWKDWLWNLVLDKRIEYRDLGISTNMRDWICGQTGLSKHMVTRIVNEQRRVSLRRMRDRISRGRRISARNAQ